METKDTKFEKLTNDSVPKLILKLAVPTIISMLVTTFYNMADTYFVGTINPSASGAVGVIFSFMAVIQAFGFFFGHGSGNYISRQLGNRNSEEAEKMASTGFFSALGFGTLIMIFGLIFIEPITVFLGSTETIKPYAVSYLKFILIGAPYMTASLVLNNQLRFQGSAFYAMIGIFSGAVLNVGLDALFILKLGMGTGGAGLATVISQFASFILLLCGTFRSGNIRIHIKKYQFKIKYFREILGGGLPSLGRQSIAAVATICLNVLLRRVAGTTADEAISAMGIVTKIIGFLASSLIGFGQGFQPVCGFNYGAKKYGRVLEGFWFCIKAGAVFASAVCVLGIIFREKIIWLFTDSEIVVHYALPAFCSQCVTYVLSVWITIPNMMMQNIGETLKATILAVARQGLIFIPILFLMSFLFGIKGILYSQAVSDALTFILAVPLTLSVIKMIKELQIKQSLADSLNEN